MTENLPQGLVTVVALCYNQAAYLRQSLDSIANQVYPIGKLYIIDDGSADGSVELIEQWIGQSSLDVEFLPHSQNWGITRTMNHALSLCQTKYFHPWPCDDIMLPNKIADQIAFLESLDWEPGFMYGDIQWIDENGVVFRDSVIQDRKKLFKNGQMPSGNIFPELVKHGCFIPTASGLYVTKALKELGGFDEKLFAEDWDMFMRIALTHGIAFKDQVFSQYRRHRQSAEMSKGERYWDGHFKILPRYLSLAPQYKSLIYKKMSDDAIEACRHGYTKAIRYVWKNAWRQLDIGQLWLYVKLRAKYSGRQ
ncbi:MAG: glycosyltransferase [Breznakibacter sp.]